MQIRGKILRKDRTKQNRILGKVGNFGNVDILGNIGNENRFKHSIDVTIKFENINNDNNTRFTGAVLDGILDWEGGDHWGENGIGLVSSDRTVTIDKVISAGVHGITVGISSPNTKWKATVSVEGVKMGQKNITIHDALRATFIAIPAPWRQRAELMLHSSPGFILGRRKTGYAGPSPEAEEEEFGMPAPSAPSPGSPTPPTGGGAGARGGSPSPEERRTSSRPKKESKAERGV